MTLQVKKLIRKSYNSIFTYEPTKMSPIEFQDLSELNTVLYILVRSDTHEYTVNYSNLLRDYDFDLDTTWNVFVNKNLTQHHLDGYNTFDTFYNSYTGKLTKPVNIYYCNNADFNINYAIADNESIGNFADRFRCHDLRIEHTQVVDDNYLLPIVNGYACKAKVSRNSSAIYALHGADLVTGVETTPDVAVLDFSNVGKLTYLNLGYDAEAKVHANTYNGSDFIINNSTVLEISFPEKYNLNKYTPIVVLNGIIVLPDQIKNIGKSSISVDTRSIPLLTSNLRYSQLTNEYIDEYSRCVMPNAYDKLHKELTEGNSDSTFVVLVEGRLLVERIHSSRRFNFLETNKNGILIDCSKATFEGTVLQKYIDHTEHVILADKPNYIDKDQSVKYEIAETKMLPEEEYLISKPTDLVIIGGI